MEKMKKTGGLQVSRSSPLKVNDTKLQYDESSNKSHTSDKQYSVQSSPHREIDADKQKTIKM